MPPLPSVVAFATANQIPLERVELAPEATEPRSGDSVTALVTLFEREHYRQWLIRIGTLELTPEERAAKSPRPLVLFLSTGSKFTFAGARMALDLRLAGPFRDDASVKPAEKRGRDSSTRSFSASASTG